MGQKVNPILFRLGTSTPVVSSWYTNTESYSELLHQDLKLREFLSNVLKSRGIFLRSCNIRRSSNKLWVDIDLFFSYILTKQAKFLWARSLFKTVKKKYTKINRIKDVKNFVQTLDNDNSIIQNIHPLNTRKKYILPSGVRKKIFFSPIKENLKKKVFLSYRNRLFFFLILKKRRLVNMKKKEDGKLLSAVKNSINSCYINNGLVRLNLRKFSRLFILQKFSYNFRSFYLKKSVPYLFLKKDTFNLLELNRNLCKSIQDFSGIEEVQLNIFSNQLNFMPSFKFFQKKIFKDLVRFQRNRDLKNYFVETLENLYFIVRTFGFGNAYLLSQLLIFLLENTRKQIFIAKFFKKSLQILFQQIPAQHVAVDGIKILIKGRFNKRRRTKKVVLQEGQISLQTINIPIDYYQTQAVTIYGSFGIKIWISKRLPVR